MSGSVVGRWVKVCVTSVRIAHSYMFGCSVLNNYVAVANSGQNNFVTIRSGKFQVFKTQEFFFKILKI